MVAALVALAAVVALFVAGLMAQRYGGAEKGAGKATEKSTEKTAPEPVPGVGDPVRDGKFEFVVSRVDCSRKSVGLEHLQRTAKGRYCLVSLSVRNIADAPKYFVGRAQEAFDAAGTGYGNDELAGVYANRNTQTFVRKLEPGERVSGALVYDVPKKVVLTSLKLHDSLLSGGVTVALG